MSNVGVAGVRNGRYLAGVNDVRITGGVAHGGGVPNVILGEAHT